jgi:hypothetical protein
MATRNVTFTWSQVLPIPNNITAWGLYYSLVSGGPYTKAGSDESFVTELAQYSATRSITVTDIYPITVYFVVDTVYTGGLRTDKSNEDSVLLIPPLRTLFHP